MVSQKKADISFLQETHSRKELEKQWMNEWDGKIFLSHASPNSCGVAVLIRNNFNSVIKNTVIDPSGRFIVLGPGRTRANFVCVSHKYVNT